MEQQERDFYYLLRRKKKISIKELSESIQCSQSLLSMFERGLANMSIDKIHRYKRYISDNKNTKTITLFY